MSRFHLVEIAFVAAALLVAPSSFAQTPTVLPQPDYTIRDASTGKVIGYLKPTTVPNEYAVQAPDGRVTAHVKPNAAGGQTIRAPNGKVLGYAR